MKKFIAFTVGYLVINEYELKYIHSLAYLFN